MTTATATKRMNPFPGLRPFKEEEEYLFFGREQRVDAMVDKLAATHFLAVLGTSGSGKSSLVNCGLRPSLNQGLMATAGANWRMAQFRPGSDPLGALADALAKDGVLFDGFEERGLRAVDIVDTTLRMSKLGLADIYEQAHLPPGTNLLVVVDQFEELFRYRQLEAAQHDKAVDFTGDATAFVNLLLEAGKQREHPIYIVLTMRSDFLGDCTVFRDLAETMNMGQYLVPRMTREERRAAIRGPAGIAGAQIAPVLLTRLVNDVGDNPDQLSILQHALNRTWTAWEEAGGEGPVELPHYEAIGGMARALDKHAEESYAALGSDRQKQICEKLFKALTDKADSRGVRRPTKLATLCGLADATQDEVEQVIEVFREPSRSFLMPPAADALTPESVIDISHESLMRVWKRLDRWTDEEAESATSYRRLAETSVLHATGQAGLWQDPDLELAVRWREKNTPNEAWGSRYHPRFVAALEFLDESTRVAKVRRRRRIGTWIGTAVGLILIGAIVAILQTRAAEEAQDARDEARREKARALRQQGRLESLGGAQGAALVPLSRALEKLPTDKQTRFLIARAMQTLDRQLHLLEGHQSRVNSVRWSRDDRLVVTASVDGTARIWNADDGTLLHELKPGEGELNSARFSHDGRYVVTAGDDGTAQIFAVTTGKLLAKLRGLGGVVRSAVFTPDGRRLLTATKETGTIRIFDTSSLGNDLVEIGPLQEIKAHEKLLYAIELSPDGKYVLTASQDGTAKVFDASTLELQTATPPAIELDDEGKARGPYEVYMARFDSAGKRFVTASEAKIARVFDAATGKQISKLEGHTKLLYAVEFSPDGSRVVTASADGTARIFDAATGRELVTLQGHGAGVMRATFQPDGELVATACEDGMVRFFDARTGDMLASRQGHTATVYKVSFSRDGKRIATAGEDGTARIFDTRAVWLRKLGGQRETTIYGVELSQGGEHMVIAGAGGSASIVDVMTGETLDLHGHTDHVYAAAFTATGNYVVTASKDKTARVFDTRTGARRGPMQHGDRVYWALCSPDGTRAVTSCRRKIGDTYTKDARLFDTETGMEISALGSQLAWVNRMAFSPDGKHVWTANDDGSVRIFDSSSGKLQSQHGVHRAAVVSLSFSPNGRHVVTASWDGTAKILDAATGDEWRTLEGHTHNVTSAAFDADGKRIVTGSSDMTARIWDAESGTRMATLEGHTSAVLWVAFSPDGNLVATAGQDRTARVFEATTGKALAVFGGHRGRINYAAFSTDGSRLITHSWDWNAWSDNGDRSVRIWDTSYDQRSPEEILEDVERRVPYRMSEQGVVVARPLTGNSK